VEKVLKHFTGNTLKQYEGEKDWVEIPKEVFASYFQILARFQDEKVIECIK
jgi:hypothetical protein